MTSLAPPMSSNPSMDTLKTQILTLTALKGDGIFTAVWSIIMLGFVERLLQILPRIGTWIQGWTRQRIDNSVVPLIASKGTEKRERTASVLIERDYTRESATADFVDAIIDHLTRLTSVKHLKYRTTYFVVHKEEFPVSEEIMARCTRAEVSQEGDMEQIAYELYSYTLTIQELRSQLAEIHRTYILNRKNQLGEQRYFFENIVSSNRSTAVASSFLHFQMTPFYTSKDLTTIYGEDMKDVITRIRFFIDNRAWYQRKGIPHTLGLLLSGPPGCGKTSLIKAISRETNRHIFHIQLNDTITKQQLRYLFLNEDIQVVNRRTGQTEQYVIPIRDRIYVMEDVDCMSRILYAREFMDQTEQSQEAEELREYNGMVEASQQKGGANSYIPTFQQWQETRRKGKAATANPDALTLSFFLNLLDGILEIPDRILILTSNHPERLDPALIRPGRIDLNIHFGLCSKGTVFDLFLNFFDTVDQRDEWMDKYGEQIQSDTLSPAEVQQVLFEHWQDPEGAIEGIVERMKGAKRDDTQTNTERILDDILGTKRDEPPLGMTRIEEPSTTELFDNQSVRPKMDTSKRFDEQFKERHIFERNLMRSIEPIKGDKISMSPDTPGDISTPNYASLQMVFGQDNPFKLSDSIGFSELAKEEMDGVRFYSSSDSGYSDAEFTS